MTITPEMTPDSDPPSQGCLLPPEGWYCSRAPGHEGPCAARPDKVAGWKTMADGSHQPLHAKEAEALWKAVEAEKARRHAEMPDEATAIRRLWDAQERLKELGWKDPVYAPKDGSPLDIIELGSTGIHRGHYEGEWPKGSWWIYDGDIYPSRPALARVALARIEAGTGETACGLDGEATKAGIAPNPIGEQGAS